MNATRLTIIFALNAFLFCTAASVGTDSMQEKRKPWRVPKRALRMKNPVKPSVKGLALSKKLYMKECASCHGKDGKGKGSAAKGLEVKPADHTNPDMNKEVDGSIFWKIRIGRQPMPSFRGKLKKEQMWGLVNYIRTLHKKPATSKDKKKPKVDKKKPASKGEKKKPGTKGSN